MNLQPSFDFWMSTVGVAAVGAALLMGLAGVVAMRCRSGRVQRAVWLGAFAATGLFLLGFVTGADRWLGTVRPATGPGEPMFLIRTDLPVEEAGFGETPLAGVSGGRIAAGEEVLFAGRAGWWPAWIWLGGILWVLGRAGFERIALRVALRGERSAVGRETLAALAALAARLGVGRRVRVCQLPGLATPAALGWWRPTVLVPDDFEAVYPARQRETMLAHELAHLAARDPLWHGISCLLLAMLWWHPLVWWGWQRLRAASEIAADEASVVVENGPVELAACLVALGGRLKPERSGWLGVTGNGFRSGLGRRVERLLALPAVGGEWRARRVVASLMLMVSGGLALALLGVTAVAFPAIGEGRPILFPSAQTVAAPSAAPPAPAEAMPPALEPPAAADGQAEHPVVDKVQTPPQVTIEARFVELIDEAGGWEALRLWTTRLGRLPQPTPDKPGEGGEPTAAAGVFPGAGDQGAAAETVVRGGFAHPTGPPENFPQVVPGDQVDWPGRHLPGMDQIRVEVAPGWQATAVLTPAQHRTVLEALWQRSGVQMLSAPRVITLSGRQAQIQVVDLRTIVTGAVPEAGSAPGQAPGGSVDSASISTVQVPVGPTLDVIPQVEADGYRIRLTLIPAVTEFLGATPLDPLDPVMPLPVIRVRRSPVAVIIDDGETVVLISPAEPDGLPARETVAGTGSPASAGRASGAVRKSFLLLITATQVDPAGNPVHAGR